MTSKLSSLGRKGFTLMEMMVVLVIIGILARFLMPGITSALDSANMTASERNMSKMYKDLLMYKTSGKNIWPRENGQEFLLAPWRAKMFEHTPQRAGMYFSPSLPFEEFVMEEGLDVVDYLDGPIRGPNLISYAGFTNDGDRSIRKKLSRSPGSTTIASDMEWVHRAAIIYMRGDGAVARYAALDIEAMTGLVFESEEIFAPGPGCGIPEFETVSND